MLISHVFEGKSGSPVLEALEWKSSPEDNIIDIANDVDEFMYGKYVSISFDNRAIEMINTTTDSNTCVIFKPGMMAIRSKYNKNQSIGFMSNKLVYSNYKEILDDELERDF